MTQSVISFPICQDDNKKTSILVVVEGREDSENIRQCLEAVSSDRHTGIIVHSCDSISQLLSSECRPSVDFVAFVIDASQFQVLNKVESQIKKLNKAFLLDRICLVVDTSQNGAYTHTQDVILFKQKYQLQVLWGNIQDQCLELCQRLFNLVTAVCGTYTGFPLILIEDRYVLNGG